jgi:Flp pilus assembly protein TadG
VVVHRVRQRLRDQRGTALIEFAIVAVLFLGLIYGAISYGVVFWVKATVTHAAEEGARAAVRGTSAGDSVSKATSKAQDVVTKSLPAGYAANTTYSVPTPAACASDASVSCITVTVTYPYSAHPILPALTPIFPILPGNLSSTSVVQLTN